MPLLAKKNIYLQYYMPCDKVFKTVLHIVNRQL